LRIKNAVRWIGDQPIYGQDPFYGTDEQKGKWYNLSLTKPVDTDLPNWD
jgi:hypothetical protein